jgi:hypothetical protein
VDSFASPGSAAPTAGSSVFIQTEHGHPSSLDPLDADQSQNIRFARMIYATPLEVSPDGVLSSSVLDSFSYDPGTRTVTWQVREGLRYSDGSSILPADIAFAVARMARARPEFPVLRYIKGLGEWLPNSATQAFPDGIKVQGRTVTITFTSAVEHPLFRFALELFSIIPPNKIDLTTNKIKDGPIPLSGYYRFDGEIGGRIDLKLRSDLPPDQAAGKPKAIVFLYRGLKDVLESLSLLDANTVILASDSELMAGEAAELSRVADVFTTPASWFAGVVFSPHWPSLADGRCRRLLAAEIRETVKQSIDLGLRPEASIFTSIVPGYLTQDQLASRLPKVSAAEREECLAALRRSPPVWGIRGAKRWQVFETLIRRTYERLAIKVPEAQVVPGTDELVSIYKQGRIGLLPGGSGFWALDPGGDIKMLFTRNLHPGLSVVSDDDKLQEMLAALGADGTSKRSQYEEINRYLFENALYNVYSHSSRLFIVKKGGGFKRLPLGLTLPPPWMLFNQ